MAPGQQLPALKAPAPKRDPAPREAPSLPLACFYVAPSQFSEGAGGWGGSGWSQSSLTCVEVAGGGDMGTYSVAVMFCTTNTLS